ncbi:hypothetical protein Hypma_002695 [Hypsizygus marmoreus]|uniref:Uncharacterized protein n=1 Tax=Hypsizygus marmoreus TaxID=39966 RepID=A0A369J486_HYPMA|nr:hypothetical protein Hypma_002695 [Hypsizygus marmoreus]
MYTDSIIVICLAHPKDTLLLYDQIKQHVANLTGIKPIKNNMYVNSCMAYTGPYVEKEACYHCDPGLLAPSQECSGHAIFLESQFMMATLTSTILS